MDYICIIIPVCSYRQQLVTEDMELIGSCASNPLRCVLDVLLRFCQHFLREGAVQNEAPAILLGISPAPNIGGINPLASWKG